MKILLAGILILAVAAISSEINSCFDDPASLQLPEHKATYRGPLEAMTTSFGAPVDEKDTITVNGDLMANRFFVDTMGHLMRQTAPPRVTHVKGAGAYGYFRVTHNITMYCKAKLFSHIGKVTPVFVRFSHSSVEKGEADTIIDNRGFATKFYTEEGNFDLAALNTPFFKFKDPYQIAQISRATSRNPRTNLRDPHLLWEQLLTRPVALPFYLYLWGFAAIPDGFRCMAGYGVHTFQIYNHLGTSYFVRWHKIPKIGVKHLDLDEALNIACRDPDYAIRDLYNAIANRNYPTYTLGIQIITKQHIDENPFFDFFDVTKLWPESRYPVIPVGDIVLNRNPLNYFSEVEKAAFCPGNLVPGIRGCPDNLFKARSFAYRDAQRHRLGVNFDDIPVNRPATAVHTYDQGPDGPNNILNTYNTPVAFKDENRPDLITIKQYDDSPNFDQIAEIYRNMPLKQRQKLVTNIVYSLRQVNSGMQVKVLNLLGSVDTDLKFRVAVGLAHARRTCRSI